jgi:hypothetical protein
LGASFAGLFGDFGVEQCVQGSAGLVGFFFGDDIGYYTEAAFVYLGDYGVYVVG